MIGASIPRVEDERFLRGEGRYVADLRLPFTVEASILRSPHPHARIRAIDTAPARAVPGVEAVVTANDLPRDLPPIPCRIPTHGNMEPFLQPVLADNTVRYVGEPLAVVVAASRALAEDAAGLISLEWDLLPPVSDSTSATLVHAGGNVASQWSFDLGHVDKAIAQAAFTVTESFAVQRHTAMPLETRGLLASYEGSRHTLEVHGPTKVPHPNRK